MITIENGLVIEKKEVTQEELERLKKHYEESIAAEQSRLDKVNEQLEALTQAKE